MQCYNYLKKKHKKMNFQSIFIFLLFIYLVYLPVIADPVSDSGYSPNIPSNVSDPYSESVSGQNISLTFISFSPETDFYETQKTTRKTSDPCFQSFSGTVNEVKNISMTYTMYDIIYQNYIKLKNPNSNSQPVILQSMDDTTTGTFTFPCFSGLYNVTLSATDNVSMVNHSWTWFVYDDSLSQGTIPDGVNVSPYITNKTLNGLPDSVNSIPNLRFIKKYPNYSVVEKKLRYYDGIYYCSIKTYGMVNSAYNISMNLSYVYLYPNGTFLTFKDSDVAIYNINNDTTMGIFECSALKPEIVILTLHASDGVETTETSWVCIVSEPDTQKRSMEDINPISMLNSIYKLIHYIITF